MKVLSHKANQFTVAGVVIFWIVITAGLGGWMWTSQQRLLNPDTVQVKQAKIELDVVNLNKAITLLHGE